MKPVVDYIARHPNR